MTSAPGERPAPDWAPTRALRRAVGVSCLLFLVAVVLGRPELVVPALPLVAGTTWALLRRRPAGLPSVSLAVETPDVAEGEEVRAVATVSTEGVGVPLDAVVVRATGSRWLGLRAGGGAYALPLRRGEEAALDLHGRALRWGRHALGPVEARAVACSGLLESRPVRLGGRVVRVQPVHAPFTADDAVPRAAGPVGVHRSRRPGEGGELSGVRPYAPGDRLRRVDWRVSLRARELYVAATLSERDADVVLVLDTLHDVGHSEGIDGAASALDTALRASAAIGEHYLRRGDRVSWVEYSPRLRHLPPAGGRRQLRAALQWLLDTEVLPEGSDPGTRLLGPRLLPPTALLVVLTPLVDPRSTAVLATLAQHGRSLLAVDTLPPGVRPDHAGRWTDAAWRLWRLERETTVGRLRETGVPVVAWGGAGSLDAVLRDVARLAAAPRALR